jgi:hypothetical protein
MGYEHGGEDKTLYRWNNIKWTVYYDLQGEPYKAEARCPVAKCHCKLIKSKDNYVRGEYKHECIKCNFKIILNKSIENMENDFLKVIEAEKYKDAEIINIGDELVRVQRGGNKDEDYWVDVKIAKNKKDELQLMVLAGSRKKEDKVQLFLEPTKERLAFDQNNDHPRQIFTKVIGIFKNSKSEISSKKKPKD